jgi:hypothetical protein
MANSLRFLKQGRNMRRVGVNIRLRDFEQDGYCFFSKCSSSAALFRCCNVHRNDLAGRNGPTYIKSITEKLRFFRAEKREPGA